MNFEKPKARSILSLDVGRKRIGLAYSDSLCITVNILPALKREKNNGELKIINNHINYHKIKGIIVGLPLDDKGNMITVKRHELGLLARHSIINYK